MITNIVNVIVVAIVSVVIIVCSIGIIIASRFQNKQKKKYKEVNSLINKKKDATFRVKDSLTKEEINNIDSEVDVDKLMTDLYNTYLALENKIKNLDDNFDDVLTGNLKEFNINRLELFKQRGFIDITDGIDLISYCITDYNKKSLKFRLTINCFSYKMVNNEIVSGSNLEKIEKIILLEYVKQKDKWLISSYDKIYEKKLSY
ncbi:MAG: hypothetical protein IKL65_05080 [Bacilli bacterium]|nr:hypothetical protein [Bacilli bacterium]